jgi:hypothetical protein
LSNLLFKLMFSLQRKQSLASVCSAVVPATLSWPSSCDGSHLSFLCPTHTDDWDCQCFANAFRVSTNEVIATVSVKH